MHSRTSVSGPTMRNAPIRVFIVHGRDSEAKGEIVEWLKRRRNPRIEPVDFDSSKVVGDTIADAFERMSLECDAAIVLATPDDFGRLASTLRDLPRARQNVWMELGWFWARLGRHRTLLLIKGEVDIPSDYQGVIYEKYTKDLDEIRTRLTTFCRSLKTLDSDHLAEVIYVSADPLIRELQWVEIHRLARQQLVVTGISMGAVRRLLPNHFELMEKNADLHLKFMIVDPWYARVHADVLERSHRRGAVQDNNSFFGDLLRHLVPFGSVASRVSIVLHEGIPSFAAVAADGPEWGSTMVVQPFVPHPYRHEFNYPRMKLKRRATDGVYMSYWRALSMLEKQQTSVVSGIELLTELVEDLAR